MSKFSYAARTSFSLNAFGEIGLRHLHEIGGTSSGAGELGVVLLALGRIGQHVDGLGERLELTLRVRLVGATIAIGMVLPRESPESVADFFVAGRPFDAQDLVVIDLHPVFWVRDK